jgi:hypothetical protein
MSEHRPGEGGSANTPPFPRLVPDDPEDRKTSTPGTPPVSSTERKHLFAEAGTRQEIREIPIGRGEAAESKPPRDASSPESADEDEDFSDLVSDAADQVRRAGRSVNRGFQNVADQLDDFADRLEGVAGLGDARGAGKLAAVARKTSGYLGESASYLRSRDVTEMRTDLEEQVRSEPLKTLLVAAVAGWVVGKIVR